MIEIVIAVALWCQQHIENQAGYRTNVLACRQAMFACIESKKATSTDLKLYLCAKERP